ncbi:aldose epimerase family protein [Pseudahrensia aquimaris]|uniref:Aldose 1-epimerase n=1 Tax=Pseudahrensia aquimaris TaxID=744461 RepID=A0ABW3F9N7_9HYPH
MIEPFGTTSNGISVERITITGGGLTARVITYGASLQDLRLEGHLPPLVLGFDTLSAYETHGRFFGATVGRFANRIAKGRFEIDGVAHHTDLNFRERHTLHGGSQGLGVKVWRIEDQTHHSVTFSIEDPDGAMGFPGNCRHTCTYSLEPNGTLAIIMESKTDAPTITSLAHHSYFILDDSGSCLDHTLRIDANAYLPVDEDLIPTGEIRPVDSTDYDFSTPTPLRQRIANGALFDHNFCLANTPHPLTEIAEVASHKSGVKMIVATTEPGLQFYAAHAMDIPVTGLMGEPYGPHSGFALETQIWPDAPNHANFPTPLLRPGETRQQTTHYRFSK